MSLWVFGYGSLMWRPGFRFEQAVRARVPGFRRCFCIYSVHHRGTAARPGLVLGLDRGGQCDGVAFRVNAADAQEALAYLRAREQVNGVYREAQVRVELFGQGGVSVDELRAQAHRHNDFSFEGKQVVANAYLVERAHPSFAARLPLVTQAELIRGARGLSGNNMEYLANTLIHLRELGIRERELERLAVILGRCVSHGDGAQSAECAFLHSQTRYAAKRPIRVKRLRLTERRRFLYRTQLGKNLIA